MVIMEQSNVEANNNFRARAVTIYQIYIVIDSSVLLHVMHNKKFINNLQI